MPSVDGRGGGGEGDFDPEKIMSAKDRKRVDDFILYAIAAADEALADANWKPETDEDKERTGVMVGSGIGGLGPIADTAIVLKEQGVRRVSPFFIPSALINLAGGQISIRHGLKGPNHAAVTACATGPRHRRCSADDRAGRRGRDGGGRGRKLGRADRHRGLSGLQGALHRL